MPSNVGARAYHVVAHASTRRADAMLIEIDSISLIGPNWAILELRDRLLEQVDGFEPALLDDFRVLPRK